MTPPIKRIPFGKTGHLSSRVIFGAAALWSMPQGKGDRLLQLLLDHGINHIDTAADYGDSEVHLARWMGALRSQFFLATKTGERTAAGARASLHRSLERLKVDRVDLIQLHNLVDKRDWEIALGPGGALEALVEAKEQKLVRHIGVTGHGASVARRHLESLERYEFASVLLPYNPTMMRQKEYAADFEKLVGVCRQRGVALQTIKTVARRRWTGDSDGPQFSWYEPLRDAGAVRRAVHYALARPGFFLNSSSDATLLPLILDAACDEAAAPTEDQIDRDIADQQMESLFPDGVDSI